MSFVQSLCQAQILIRGILNVCLWLKFSPSLTLNKIEHFKVVSPQERNLVVIDSFVGNQIFFATEYV
jgi:hypothetical protein